MVSSLKDGSKFCRFVTFERNTQQEAENSGAEVVRYAKAAHTAENSGDDEPQNRPEETERHGACDNRRTASISRRQIMAADAYRRVLIGMPSGANASRMTFSSPTATIAVREAGKYLLAAISTSVLVVFATFCP